MNLNNLIESCEDSSGSSTGTPVTRQVPHVDALPESYEFNFVGQTVVITGINGGFGQTIAAAFQRCGAHVIGIDRESHPASAYETFVADVSDHTQVASAFAALIKVHGAPHVLVNNAGIREVDTIITLDPDEWDRVVNVNLNGAFYCAREAAIAMKDAGRRGTIISTASAAGFIAASHRPAYVATKHALVGLTKQLALDLSPYGIRVNAVAPGNIRTPLTESYYADPRFVADLEQTIPSGGTGTTVDVANMFLFLASPFSSYVNGQSLLVDGGFTTSKAFTYNSDVYTDSSASTSARENA